MVEMTTSAPYYGDSAVMRTPPPDLPSLLLKERIVYLGLPLFSDDDAKRQMGIDVTELIIAQLLYLEFDNPEKPIYFYINSTGTSWYSGDAIGFETEAFAICRHDPLRQAAGAHHLHRPGDGHRGDDPFSAGTKGHRAALPHASIVLHQPRSGARGQATRHPDPGQGGAAQQAAPCSRCFRGQHRQEHVKKLSPRPPIG